MRILGTVVILCVLSSCSSTTLSRKDSRTRSSGMVSVNVVGACPVRSLSGATVELRSKDSALLAQTLTGSDGSAAFSAAVFKQAAVIVVCHDDFFCGVLKLTNHTGTAFFIALAPAMLSSTHIDGNEYRAALGYGRRDGSVLIGWQYPKTASRSTSARRDRSRSVAGLHSRRCAGNRVVTVRGSNVAQRSSE